jgi:PTS system mannose-specific IIA component
MQRENRMIGMVIVAQGRLAIELRATLEHVMGRQPQLELVSTAGEADIERDRARLAEAVRRADTGDGVVVLTDMFDAPASDLAKPLATGPKLEVIGGVNVPTLIKLASIRRGCCSVAEAANAAQEAGRKHIRHCPESAARFSH